MEHCFYEKIGDKKKDTMRVNTGMVTVANGQHSCNFNYKFEMIYKVVKKRILCRSISQKHPIVVLQYLYHGKEE